MDVKITPSSGNVFTDLGFGDDEAEHLRLRSTLMIEVRKLIEEHKFTQAEAASLSCSASRSRGSAISFAEGLILFSIDTLVGMLARAGIHVDVVSSTARKGAA